jgi:hypothetical protein
MGEISTCAACGAAAARTEGQWGCDNACDRSGTAAGPTTLLARLDLATGQVTQLNAAWAVEPEIAG